MIEEHGRGGEREEMEMERGKEEGERERVGQIGGRGRKGGHLRLEGWCGGDGGVTGWRTEINTGKGGRGRERERERAGAKQEEREVLGKRRRIKGMAEIRL